MRLFSSGRPKEPAVSGVTKTLASCAGVWMPRRASAPRNALSLKAKLKSETSWIVSPNWPSLMGIRAGGA